jgi:hypothetical protein
MLTLALPQCSRELRLASQLQAKAVPPKRREQPAPRATTCRKACIDGVDVLDIREGKVARILTAFDLLPAAEQLLGLRLRPVPGTWRAKGAVAVQGALAYLARRRK